jgi:hypothetical protein
MEKNEMGGHVVWMEEGRGVYRDLVGKRPIRILRHRW